MTVTLDVPSGALQAARSGWSDASEDLDHQWRRLHRVGTGRLAPAVASALEAFREVWVDELKATHRRAEGFVEAIDDTGADLTVTDRSQARLVRGLLSWDHRNAPIIAG